MCLFCVCVWKILHFSVIWLRFAHHRQTDFIIHWAYPIFVLSNQCACIRVPHNDQTKGLFKWCEQEKEKKNPYHIFNAPMHLHEHRRVHNTPIILLVKRAQNLNMWSGNSVSTVIQLTLAQEEKNTTRNKEIKNRLDFYLCEFAIHFERPMPVIVLQIDGCLN